MENERERERERVRERKRERKRERERERERKKKEGWYAVLGVQFLTFASLICKIYIAIYVLISVLTALWLLAKV